MFTSVCHSEIYDAPSFGLLLYSCSSWSLINEICPITNLNGKLARSNVLANDNQRDRRGNDLEEPAIETDKADQAFMLAAKSIVFGTGH